MHVKEPAVGSPGRAKLPVASTLHILVIDPAA